MNILDTYISQNVSSREAYQRACKDMPSGCTRSVLYWSPFPLYLKRGKGSHLWDLDGNERIDFNYNNTVLILGHNHPKVVEAAQEQFSNSTVIGSPTENEPKLADELVRRLDNAEKVRFTPSGTEANMQAIRVARAYSGQKKVAKGIGAYHGSWDGLPIVPGGVGIPEEVHKNVLFFPYNDAEAVEELVKKHHKQLAAVILEPTQRDMTPKPGFLEGVREVTEDYDVLLVFDEVISFRLSYGGAQKKYGVFPDITSMGKIIGGGFPVGAYASTEEVMSVLEIRQEKPEDITPPTVGFSGTFNAHPITMAAGTAVMKELKPEAYNRINSMGKRMREGLKEVLKEQGVNAHVGGMGSLFHIGWTDQEIYNHKTASTSDRVLKNYFSLGMMNKGIFILGHPNVSTAQSDEDIDKAIQAANDVIDEIKPIIKKRNPNLLN